MEWKDISSAPKDGTAFLAAGGGCGPDVLRCAYNERVGCWDCGDLTLDDYDDEPEGYSRPKFWMPLPAPPPKDAAR